MTSVTACVGNMRTGFRKGSNVVVLDPDVARVFTDSESVNQALRALAEIIQHQSDKAHP